MDFDYVKNSLLASAGSGVVRFFPPEQLELLERALKTLTTEGYHVFWGNVSGATSALSLLEAVSVAIGSPTVASNWGIISDALYEMPWLPRDYPGYFLYLANALPVWKADPLLASRLVEAFQPVAFWWAQRNTRMVLIFGMAS